MWPVTFIFKLIEMMFVMFILVSVGALLINIVFLVLYFMGKM